MSNQFLEFCPDDTGTNLLSEADYLASDDRVSGNKPGVASSKLVNRALRQSAYITSQLAELIAGKTGTDVLDDATPTKLLAQLTATLIPLPPKFTKYLSGSGTHNLAYYFFIATGSATAAATYTNNSVTFTVVGTVASGTLIQMTGSGAPAASGTLTKTGGTGDSTLTFYAVRAPIQLEVEMVGGGGGGAGSGTASATNGTAGNNTTFGSSLLVAGGGSGGVAGGMGGPNGGSASLGSGPVGLAFAGTAGSGSGTNVVSGATQLPGGSGGSTAFGGGGVGQGNGSGTSGTANTGAGGAGGGTSTAAGCTAGVGGAAGGYVFGIIFSPASSYSYAVAATSAGGAAGTSGFGAGNGAAGFIGTLEKYQ